LEYDASSIIRDQVVGCQATKTKTGEANSMSGDVVSIEAGRKRLQERQEAKERFKRRRVALGLADAPEATPSDLNGLPKWPGGIDDLEVEQ
jgi:hypothetical protein